MATNEDAAMNETQLWSAWAVKKRLNLNNCMDDEEEKMKPKESESKKDLQVTKAKLLPKDDMRIFGFCPAWDNFFLAVCDVCGSVVKPQSLKNHIDRRHKNIVFLKTEKSEVSQTTEAPPTVSKSVNKNTRPISAGHCYTSPRNLCKLLNEGFNNLPSMKPEKTKNHSRSKKETLAPVVRVERIVPHPVKHPPLNTVSSEKKQLPSPQQPPPLHQQQNADVPKLTVDSVLMSPLSVGPTTSTTAPMNTISNSIVPIVPSMKSENHKNISSITPTLSTITKEKKFIRVKDREYDPNKHCGVLIDGKPCKKSLTCTDHLLQFRRAVKGREKPFDVLILEHKAAKLVAPKSKSLVVPKKEPILLSPPNTGHCSDEVNPPVIEYVVASSITSPATCATKTNLGSCKTNQSVSSQPRPYTMTSVPNQISNSMVVPIPSVLKPKVPPATCVQPPPFDWLPEPLGKSVTEPVFIRGVTPDPPYITHHPRPCSMSSFGFRRLNNNRIMTSSRSIEKIQSAFRLAVCSDKPVQQPVKKRCTELHHLVSEQADPSDPYDFTCTDTASLQPPVQTLSMSQLNVKVVSESVLPVANIVVHSGLAPISLVNRTKQSSVQSHRPSQPKTSATKSKGSSTISKKKRTLPSVPNGTNVSMTATPLSVLSPGGLTISPVMSPPQSLPFAAFPYSFADPYSTMPRFQIGSPNTLTLTSPTIIRTSELAPFAAAQQSPVMKKDRSVLLASFEPLNGQLPVQPSLLHSLTVNKPLLPVSTGHLGLTFAETGLLGQFSQIPVDETAVPMSTNKGSHTINSILNSSQPRTGSCSSTSTWSQAKAKSKSRKNSRSSSNNVPHTPTYNISYPALAQPLVSSNSAQVCVSPPLHNGLVPSSPFFSSKINSISGTTINSQPVCLSPVSRTPSPHSDLSSPLNRAAQKAGRNSSEMLHRSLPRQANRTSGPSTFKLVPVTLMRAHDNEDSVGELQDSQPTLQSLLMGSSSQRKDDGITTKNLTSLKMPLLMPSLSSSQILQLPAEFLQTNGMSRTTGFNFH